VAFKLIIFTLIALFKSTIYFNILPAKAFFLFNFNQVNVYIPLPFTIAVNFLFTINHNEFDSIIKVIIFKFTSYFFII
jgi:hypothetical protein